MRKTFINPKGRILDIGAGCNPSYMRYLREFDFEYITADGNPDYSPDILINIEEPFPIKNAAFDGVFLFNVLEHTYNHQEALAEINRILNPEANCICWCRSRLKYTTLHVIIIVIRITRLPDSFLNQDLKIFKFIPRQAD